MIEQLKQRYAALRSDERLLIHYLAIAVAAFLIYMLFVLPLRNHNEKLILDIEKKQSLLQWMQQTAPKITGAKPIVKSSGPLSTQVESALAKLAARDAQIKNAKQNQVKLSVKSVPFSHCVKWLAQLEQSGISVDSIKFKRLKSPGMVDAEITLVAN